MNFDRSILLLLFFIILSCDKKEESKALKIYNYQDFRSKVKIVDTACINAKEKAYNDINTGKIYYSIKLYKPYDYNKLQQKFAALKIIPDTTSREDIRDSNGYLMYFHKKCYQSVMQEYVLQKYKYNTLFLDSIAETVEQQYIIDHPNYIASMRDLDSFYSNDGAADFDNLLNKIRLKFNYDFIFPEDYKSDNEKKSKTTANFILLKNGNIKNLNLKSTFNNAYNAKFSKYFNDYISHLIRSEKWPSAYSVNLPVNANVEIVFKYK